MPIQMESQNFKMKPDQDFSRQSFLGPNSEHQLADTCAVIVGLGGGGSHIAQQLAHIGVGTIRLIDPQQIEASNLNRLVGATDDDVNEKRSKVQILKCLIHSIRPWIKVDAVESTWQKADRYIKDAHVLFGCVDGYQQRDFLEVAARRHCLPFIDIGMDVTKVGQNIYAVAGQTIVSLPNKPCMRCIGFITSDRLAREENNYGHAGFNPQVIWTNGTLASLAVGEFVKLRTPWFAEHREFVWLELDGNSQTIAKSRQPEYYKIPERCPHHGGNDGLGDAFFDIRSALKA